MARCQTGGPEPVAMTTVFSQQQPLPRLAPNPKDNLSFHQSRSITFRWHWIRYFWIRIPLLCMILIVGWITLQGSEFGPVSLRIIRSYGPNPWLYIQPEVHTVLLQPEVCSSDTYLVIVVCSAVENQIERQAIRETWGSIAMTEKEVRLTFLVGKHASPHWQAKIEEESRNHADIIQENFLDTYDNLTLKTVFLLKWINQACSHAEYVLKTDDDMFINVPNLLDYLKRRGSSRMLMGSLIEGAVPLRTNDSKWVASETYLADIYPDYLSGTAYVISGDLVRELYTVALDTSLFRLEDIFLTGICAERLDLTLTDNRCFHYSDFIFDSCRAQRIISAHRQNTVQLHSIWRELHNPDVQCENFVVKYFLDLLKPFHC